MSDLALVPTSDVEQTPPRRDVLAVLRQAVATLDADALQLHTDGEFETLAHGLADLDTLLADLRLLRQTVEGYVVDLIPSKRVELDGLVLERKKATDRKQWQSLDLLDRIIRDALVDRTTGEFERDPDVVRQRIRDEVAECAPITPSLGWRVGALRERGLDPDEWCSSTPGRTGVQITKEKTT